MSILGIITPGVVNQNYLGEVFRGVADTAKQHRHTLLLNIQNSTRSDNLDDFLGHGCDGVILVVPEHYKQVVEKCQQYRREYVQVDYLVDMDVEGLPIVESDNWGGIQLVMRHLLDLGHRRIGFVTGWVANASAAQRLASYRAVLEAAGIAYDPEIVIESGWMRPDGYEAGKRLFRMAEVPTAVVASNDGLAFGVNTAAQEMALHVPHDLSITGVDDVRASSMIPPLTSVRQPVYDLGKTAVQLLLKRLRREPTPELHVRLPTELIIRHSTGPAARR